MRKIISTALVLFIILSFSFSAMAVNNNGQSGNENKNSGSKQIVTEQESEEDAVQNTEENSEEAVDENTGEGTGEDADEAAPEGKQARKEAVNALKEQLKENQHDKEQRKIILKQMVELIKSANKPNPVLVNGEEVEFDVPPVIKQNRMLIPVRAVTKALGAEVKWDPLVPNIVTISKTITDAAGVETTITVIIDLEAKTITKNGEAVELDVPAQLISNRTMVPIRFFAETFGMKVEYDDDTGGVFVDDPDEDEEAPETTTGAAVTFVVTDPA